MLDRRASQVLRDVPRTEPLVALALVANAAALVVNSLLGQLAMGVVTHPFSKTLVNQTIGLEAVSLLLVLWSLGTV